MRAILASADYYQGFLPNAGNGKRVQRYPEEWAAALREMAGLGAEILLPAHGEAIAEASQIRTNLLVLAEALQHIVDHTIAGLNAGLRQDQIYRSVRLPEHLASDPTLRVQYVSPSDISKMVIRRYTGWWDDIPSHWTPAPLELRAREIVGLAGGMEKLAARARELAQTDLRLACHLADYALEADPGNSRVREIVAGIYEKRAASETSLMAINLFRSAAAYARAGRPFV